MAAEEAPVLLSEHMAFELAVRFAEELAMELLAEQMVEETVEQGIAAAVQLAKGGVLSISHQAWYWYAREKLCKHRIH